MELEGKVWKDGNYWLVEVPVLDVMTQGKSKKDALLMIEDAIQGLLECCFDRKIKNGFSIKAAIYKGDIIGIKSNDISSLISLSLIRQRRKSKPI